MRVFATLDELATAAADLVAETIRERAATRLALTGETTPRGCYERLARLDLPGAASPCSAATSVACRHSIPRAITR